MPVEYYFNRVSNVIIKFSKDIELADWHTNNDSPFPIWHRKLVPYEDYDEVIIVSVRSLRDNYTHKCCYANFYSQLSFLHSCFPRGIDGDLEFAKQYVDNFLIKMSKLTAFL